MTLVRSAPITEAVMLRSLRAHYERERVEGAYRYVCANHVSHGRIADFFAIDCWHRTRQAIHGHENKVSRSDWLAELRDPTKAEEFKRYVDRWWLVVSDRQIVRSNELPTGWGLMEVKDGNVAVVQRAPKLHPEPMPRSVWVAVLRASAKTARASVECDTTPNPRRGDVL